VASNGTDEEIKKSSPAKVQEQLQALLKFYRDSQVPEFELIELDKVKYQAEFNDVRDRVLNYIKPMHNWRPNISKIEKISNAALEKKFNAAKTKCAGSYVALKFHGTGRDGIEKIPREGFKMPDTAGKRHMYGPGIYFATDSSKSAQEIYTKGTRKLLLCDVLLGKEKIVRKADPSLTLQKIRAEGYDSVLAPRDSKALGGVLYDEVVVYDPNQAIPRYIIHYRTSQESLSSSESDDEDLGAPSFKQGLLTLQMFLLPSHLGFPNLNTLLEKHVTLVKVMKNQTLQSIKASKSKLILSPH